jgi:hypothetical protein
LPPAFISFHTPYAARYIEFADIDTLSSFSHVIRRHDCIFAQRHADGHWLAITPPYAISRRWLSFQMIALITRRRRNTPLSFSYAIEFIATILIILMISQLIEYCH